MEICYSVGPVERRLSSSKAFNISRKSCFVKKLCRWSAFYIPSETVKAGCLKAIYNRPDKRCHTTWRINQRTKPVIRYEVLLGQLVFS